MLLTNFLRELTNSFYIIIKMPQLDIDLLEDFLFFAFTAIILGFGDDESEENAIEMTSEAHLAQYYISTVKVIREESRLVATSSSVVFNRLSIIIFNLFIFSVD